LLLKPLFLGFFAGLILKARIDKEHLAQGDVVL